MAERETKPWRERSTNELAYAVAGCYPPKARHGRIHPATRSFQGLRIAVNDELGALERLERLTRWPQVADPVEAEANSRSRSAMLRLARRLP